MALLNQTTVSLASEDTEYGRLQRKYGPAFPDPKLLNAAKDERERGRLWRNWIDSVIQMQQGAMQDKRLHWTRHRLFRWGHQWISTRDGRKWREMEARSNRVRKVFNVIGPGLDFRLALLQEQKPGWRAEPIPGMGIDGRETADAQQSLVEWHFRTQKMWRMLNLAYGNAQTDGVCWLELYIDKNAGPVIERVEPVDSNDDRYVGLKAQGYREEDGLIMLPLGPSQEVLDPDASPSTFRGGEIRTRMVRANETYADLEAETIRGPNNACRWFMIRRPRDLNDARIETGRMDLEMDSSARWADIYADGMDFQQRWAMGLPPYPRRRIKHDEANVWDFTIYITPDDDIGPNGKYVRIVGDVELKTGELPGGVIPIVRVTDGSNDQELFPRPVMSDWISDQVSVNALGSKILEYARMHSGTRLMALKDTLIEETWTNIVGSIITYRGQQPKDLPPPRVSPDLWSMFTQMVARLQDAIGNNDPARGKVSNVASGFQDVSGRAVLGARELAERQFGPMIRAAADAMSDWAELVIVYAQHLYTTDRLIPMVGRGDLAKRINSETLKGQPNVYMDPETLMPLPRALRNQMLIDHLDKGVISLAEYRKRSPYAEVRSLTMGDTDQHDRAQWVNTTIEENWKEYAKMDALELFSVDAGLAIFWQDNPEIHMNALNDIILDDRKPWEMRKLAADRWGIYAELARSKNHPVELEMQGVPRPPAPLEAVGVPNVVPQTPTPSRQVRPGGGVPGQAAAATNAPAPEISPLEAGLER